ncbi:MAG: sugar O-acetyltransferase, partial [Verrucomicrobiota bacterium]
SSRDPELLELYWRAREWLAEFGASGPDRERMRIFRKLVPQTAEEVWVESPFFCEYGENISIGRGSYLNINCFLQDCGRITIGEHALLGPGVQVCTASHPLESDRRVVSDPGEEGAPYVTMAKPVTIGDRSWIGANVTILGGVTIGAGVVIGAGSVVTGSIPAGTVAYGVPCRIVKTLSEE